MTKKYVSYFATALKIWVVGEGSEDDYNVPVVIIHRCGDDHMWSRNLAHQEAKKSQGVAYTKIKSGIPHSRTSYINMKEI